MNAPLEAKYTLFFDDRRSQTFTLKTDDTNHQALDVPDSYQPPSWALLNFRQCRHCPLDPEKEKYCPIARNMAYLLENTTLGCSHSAITLHVTIGHRTMISETTVQRALSSLFGLVCGLSSCPYTRPFRPMAIFHLPLATDLETLFRATSIFLLRAYFVHLENPKNPVNLEEMKQTYSNLALLNKGLAQRFREVYSTDSHTNAVVLLDILAKDISFEMDDQLNILKELL